MPIPSINQISLVHSEDPGTPNVTLGRVGVGATEQTYLINNFNPQADPSTYSDLSWTSARKAQRRYNTYQSTDKYSVFCYVDDWAQYDSRYKIDENPVKFDTGGRGADYLWLENSGYDKLVLGFAGLCWALLGFAGLCWALLGFAGLCWALLGFAGLCWALLGLLDSQIPLILE